MKCGSAGGVVGAKDFLTLSGVPTDSPEIMPVEVIADTASGKVRAYANRWPYSSKTRTLVFLTYNAAVRSFEIKRIFEDRGLLDRHEASKKAPAR